jgi:hypothetical protein
VLPTFFFFLFCLSAAKVKQSSQEGQRSIKFDAKDPATSNPTHQEEEYLWLYQSNKQKKKLSAAVTN